MIEETALVVELTDEDVWVETQRKSVCGQCAANKGCGTAVLGKVLGVKRNKVRILNPKETKVSVGDKVVVGIEEKALVRGSLAVYMAPLILLFMFGLLGDVLAKQMNISSAEVMIIVFSFIGLYLGFLWANNFSQKISNDSRYQPILLYRDLS